jgi:hypothetical protein
VKLTDFGIAKHQSKKSRASEPDQGEDLVHVAEQAAGADIDARTTCSRWGRCCTR